MNTFKVGDQVEIMVGTWTGRAGRIVSIGIWPTPITYLVRLNDFNYVYRAEELQEVASPTTYTLDELLSS